MEPEYEKLDANTLKITKEVTPAIEVSTYIYNDLVSMLGTLQAEKTSYNQEVDAKIAELQSHIDAADSLGIKAVKSQFVASEHTDQSLNE